MEITELEVDGMTCTNCALNVQKYLEKIGGENVNVNFATKEVRFINSGNASLDQLKKGIASLGYTVLEPRKQEAEGKKGLTALEKKFYFSAFFTLPLLLHMFLPFVAWLQNPWLQLSLSLPVMYIGVWHFGKSAWGSVRHGMANMDVLIFIGSISAFAYSLAGTLMYAGTHRAHDFLFYETAATIITLVLLGNLIEERSVEKTTTSLKSLMKMANQKAKLVRKHEDHEEIQEIDAAQLMMGDEVQANSGDQIVADGVLIKGDAEIDESFMTGESTPVFKEEQDRLIAGSVVISGSVRYKVKRAGKHTALANIIEMVKDAQSRKPSIQKLGDRVSAVFVPVVVSLAALTFILSFWAFDLSAQASLMSSVAVLVISCPCAMGLATPTAIMVGVGKGAKSGVLIKGGETIETLAKVKQVVFDKTGTLTTGSFKVKDFETHGFDENVARNIVLHMEKASSHPIAKSIVKNYPDWFMMKFDYAEIREVKGKGIYAVDAGGNDFKLGKPAWVDPEGQWTKDLLLSYCGKVVASFDIEDQVKPGARETIQALNNMGIRTILLSGDNEKKCRYVAERLGLTEFYHSQLPEEKLKKIEELSAQAPTAMVGDGINDAPALSKADIGISLGDSTDIAKQSADVILMSSQIKKVEEALLLGRKTYRTIKQNLFWALAYNVVAIPIAGMGFLSPMVGALSMAFSDVVVIGNSLRLNLLKTKA